MTKRRQVPSNKKRAVGFALLGIGLLVLGGNFLYQETKIETKQTVFDRVARAWALCKEINFGRFQFSRSTIPSIILYQLGKDAVLLDSESEVLVIVDSGTELNLSLNEALGQGFNSASAKVQVEGCHQYADEITVVRDNGKYTVRTRRELQP